MPDTSVFGKLFFARRLYRAELMATALLMCAIGLRAQDAKAIVANRMVEWSFKAKNAHADPFNEIELDAVVTTPSGKTLRVPGFWAGGQSWKVRYASAEAGVHRYKTVCSDMSDAGLQGQTGEVTVAPAEGKNALYLHGPPTIAADHKHFAYADGTPFFWLADTWWMGLTKRLHWPDDLKTLASDRTSKGFTVVQIVAGLYPDMPAFDERGANEAGFPWASDYSRINPAYFDAADQRLKFIADSGLAPCIVGAWGYHLPWLGVEKMKKHWRYIVARYGALPVFWCLAGEGTMTYYLTPKEKRAEEAEFQKKGWTEIGAYVKQIDPFHHPVSIHPISTSRTQVAELTVLDFVMLQTGHSDRKSIPGTVDLVRSSVAAVPPMPVVNSEVCYEGILGTCPADVERFMAWTCMLAGTAGHTYGANGIWQVNRREAPYGKSPHGGNWGETPWDDAMRLPGSGQTGLAKKLLGEFEWWRFQPHTDWAAYEEPPSDPYMVPYAAGIAKKVRVIYLPVAKPAFVTNLEAGVTYKAEYFNPVDGKTSDLGSVKAGDDGRWKIAPPPDLSHDWAVVVQAR